MNENIAIWRQISQAIEEEISDGVLSPGEKLPSSPDLAARFGVNRHTVLKAVSYLQSEGLVRTERGGGIYVQKVIPYRMGARTRLEENLLEINLNPKRKILSVVEMKASKSIAQALKLEVGCTVTLVTLIGLAQDIPVCYIQNYFPTDRFPGITKTFRDIHLKAENISTREALSRHAVFDFRRSSISVRGRQANQTEIRHLEMASTEHVLRVAVTNIDETGTPVVYGESIFCQNRVELNLDLSDFASET